MSHLTYYYILYKDWSSSREQEGLPLDAQLECEAEPRHTAGTPKGGLPVPTRDEHRQAESPCKPYQSAHRTKEKGRRPKGAANADQDISPSIKSGLDQHNSWVTVRIVLRQANQEQAPRQGWKENAELTD